MPRCQCHRGECENSDAMCIEMINARQIHQQQGSQEQQRGWVGHLNVLQERQCNMYKSMNVHTKRTCTRLHTIVIIITIIISTSINIMLSVLIVNIEFCLIFSSAMRISSVTVAIHTITIIIITYKCRRWKVVSSSLSVHSCIHVVIGSSRKAMSIVTISVHCVWSLSKTARTNVLTLICRRC